MKKIILTGLLTALLLSSAAPAFAGIASPKIDISALRIMIADGGRSPCDMPIDWFEEDAKIARSMYCKSKKRWDKT